MKKGLVVLAAVFVLLFASVAAHAATISIRNNTGIDIWYLYISSSGTRNWEEDVLGNDILEAGETLRVNVRGSYRMFDLRVEDSSGNSIDFFEFPGNTTQITLRRDGSADYQ
jgi:hypothetical protein